ncbi:hypothetical protein [Micromonospora sp. KC207]|nr:hypothetical protein [Micromonospora sp. KC207]
MPHRRGGRRQRPVLDPRPGTNRAQVTVDLSANTIQFPVVGGAAALGF